MCCIRVKFELFKLLDIVGYICFMSIVHGPKLSFYSCYCYIDVWGRLYTCLYLGRAPHTKETLPNFREKC